jgi:hypothetical protein
MHGQPNIKILLANAILLLISAEVLLSVVINVPKYTKLLTLSVVICFTLKPFSPYFFLVPQITYLSKDSTPCYPSGTNKIFTYDAYLSQSLEFEDG